MSDDLKIKKEALRAEALRSRSLMSLDASSIDQFCQIFFDKINVNEQSIIASYWPKDREFDTHILMDGCLKRGASIALPVIDDQSLILKFAKWSHDTDIMQGKFGVCHPVIDEHTQWLEPDIIIVPLLAFDRQGYRLGFGGGYYDATLEHLMAIKNITAIGVGYAKQACLFNLPREEHDIKMDWVITDQGAHQFSKER